MTNVAPIKTTDEQKVRDAKRAFILGLVDISWKLAIAFLVPVFIGIATHFTIAGIIVGFIMSFLVIIKLAIDSGRNQ